MRDHAAIEELDSAASPANERRRRDDMIAVAFEKTLHGITRGAASSSSNRCMRTSIGRRTHAVQMPAAASSSIAAQEQGLPSTIQGCRSSHPHPIQEMEICCSSWRSCSISAPMSLFISLDRFAGGSLIRISGFRFSALDGEDRRERLQNLFLC